MRQSYIITLATVVGSAMAAPVASPKIPIHAPKVSVSISDKRAPPPKPESIAATVARQSKACFIVGDTTLPGEVSDVVATLKPSIQCDATNPTISGVPDVLSGDVNYSSVDFSKSDQSPLEFALGKFATAEASGGKLADTDLELFQNELNVYLATEAGIRSVGGSLAIKAPKFFLQMQVSRIQTAQGNPPTAAGLQVDHLRDKVIKNASTKDKAFVDQVTKLAAVLQ